MFDDATVESVRIANSNRINGPDERTVGSRRSLRTKPPHVGELGQSNNRRQDTEANSQRYADVFAHVDTSSRVMTYKYTWLIRPTFQRHQRRIPLILN